MPCTCTCMYSSVELFYPLYTQYWTILTFILPVLDAIPDVGCSALYISSVDINIRISSILSCSIYCIRGIIPLLLCSVSCLYTAYRQYSVVFDNPSRYIQLSFCSVYPYHSVLCIPSLKNLKSSINSVAKCQTGVQ